MALENNFCPKKVAAWWVITFWKKILVGTLGPPGGGDFKEIWLFFVVLGFKGLKMDKNRKVLSQISCIWMNYNIIKKFIRRPKCPLGPGVVMGAIYSKFWRFFFLLFFAKIEKLPCYTGCFFICIHQFHPITQKLLVAL